MGQLIRQLSMVWQEKQQQTHKTDRQLSVVQPAGFRLGKAYSLQ